MLIRHQLMLIRHQVPLINRSCSSCRHQLLLIRHQDQTPTPVDQTPTPVDQTPRSDTNSCWSDTNSCWSDTKIRHQLLLIRHQVLLIRHQDQTPSPVDQTPAEPLRTVRTAALGSTCRLLNKLNKERPALNDGTHTGESSTLGVRFVWEEWERERDSVNQHLTTPLNSVSQAAQTWQRPCREKRHRAKWFLAWLKRRRWRGGLKAERTFQAVVVRFHTLRLVWQWVSAHFALSDSECPHTSPCLTVSVRTLRLFWQWVSAHTVSEGLSTSLLFRSASGVPNLETFGRKFLNRLNNNNKSFFKAQTFVQLTILSDRPPPPTPTHTTHRHPPSPPPTHTGTLLPAHTRARTHTHTHTHTRTHARTHAHKHTQTPPGGRQWHCHRTRSTERRP